MTFSFHEKGKGIPVVLIHGFCETHEIWNGFDNQLASHFRVISIDLPGFGESQLPEIPFSLERVAAIVLSQLKKNHIENPVLIGHSLGGYVALAMADSDPEFCKSIVLFHSSVFADAPEKKENRNKVIDFVKANGVAPFIETFVPSLFFKKDHQTISKVKSLCLKTPLRTLIAYTEAMRDRPDRQQTVRTKIYNLLIISGQRDEIIPPSTSQKMAELKSTIDWIELNETGHMGMIESPFRSCEAIINFINSKN